jgi:hypothetical protein
MSEGQIRFLVENYYDLQKLRIEAFNRVVAWCKSQYPTETQDIGASHARIENQNKNASHRKIEIHSNDASQVFPETHSMSAIKPSILANKILIGKVEVPKDIGDLVWYFNMLHDTEKNLAKRLDTWSKLHLLRSTYLTQIQGIGPIFSSALIAWLQPISRFDNISKLWKYCGLAPDQKRRKGVKLGYNPHLKTLMWKIASSFEKQKAAKSAYRRLYDEKKKYLAIRPDLKDAIDKKVKGAKLHVQLLTLRFIAKRFLADTWVAWRRLEDLPVTEPYAIQILGHTGKETTRLDKPFET